MVPAETRHTDGKRSQVCGPEGEAILTIQRLGQQVGDSSLGTSVVCLLSGPTGSDEVGGLDPGRGRVVVEKVTPPDVADEVAPYDSVVAVRVVVIDPGIVQLTVGMTWSASYCVLCQWRHRHSRPWQHENTLRWGADIGTQSNHVGAIDIRQDLGVLYGHAKWVDVASSRSGRCAPSPRSQYCQRQEQHNGVKGREP